MHCARERGFSTDSQHIAPGKINSIEKGTEYFLRKVRFIGPQAAKWAEQLLEQRGVHSLRSLQGLLSLCKKYTSAEINRACNAAWRSNATNYRAIKKLLENNAREVQQTMEFMEEHPIIRPSGQSTVSSFVMPFKEDNHSDRFTCTNAHQAKAIGPWLRCSKYVCMKRQPLAVLRIESSWSSFFKMR